jgi:hypothetical protein
MIDTDKYQPVHSPTNFIFWLGRLIFSVSINSHPDNIYISLLTCYRLIVVVNYAWNNRKPINRCLDIPATC